jgi:hypothetical protein
VIRPGLKSRPSTRRLRVGRELGEVREIATTPLDRRLGVIAGRWNRADQIWSPYCSFPLVPCLGVGLGRFDRGVMSHD